MSRERNISRVVTPPPPAPGFIGDGHTAVPVLDPRDFQHNDPFIVLMDDRLDLEPGHPAGGPHPHGGFETVTFVVEGELRDRDEGTLKEGDVLWMTAGSGVIHGEDVVPLGKSRILQLWLTLPRSSRWTAPRFEYVSRESAPVRREPGVEVRVYSGTSGDARATTHNFVPVTLLDIHLDPNAAFGQQLPNTYNGFLYVLDGEVSAGADESRIGKEQVGWLADLDGDRDESATLRIAAGGNGAHVVLYAGEKQNVPIVQHGPFIGDSRMDIIRLSELYMTGKLPRISELSVSQSLKV
ncbi:MAG TPA: pirin-like C-terminal cupin domain-containing protein [Gemmatimonadaceae bacterium]|nr:pirin-like C-terminal cupin domain-containing protein [Gemmatimonadaceae bacterium]